jgi:phosphoglycerate dehydrogenase-like enzyme
MKTVVVAAEVDPILIELLEGDPRLRLVYSPSVTEAGLLQSVGEADILVTRYHNPVTAAVIEAATALELIVQGTSGLDNIDHDAAAARGVRVVGLPGENANGVAELTIGFMLSLTRTIPAYRRDVASGVWERSDCASRRELRGYRLGVVGIGRTGSRVARLAGAFGVGVRAYDPYLSADEIGSRGAVKCGTLDELLAGSDIATWHVPLTPETRSMISAAAIARLPRGAFVINTSRGGVADIDAILDALENGRLGGVALDVFDTEPPVGRRWPDDTRLILTPHIAGCTKEAKESIGRGVYRVIARHLEGAE